MLHKSRGDGHDALEWNESDCEETLRIEQVKEGLKLDVKKSCGLVDLRCVVCPKLNGVVARESEPACIRAYLARRGS